MKTPIDQDDQLLRKLFQQSDFKSIPDITERVMHRIDQSSELFEYRPVIGKKAWIAMGCIFSGLIIYLLFQSGEMALQPPKLMTLLGGVFQKLGGSFSFELNQIRFPEIPSTLLIAVAAFNVIGIYLMISYRWSRRMFK